MASNSLLLLLLYVITSQAAKDTVVVDLIVETAKLAANKIDNSVSRFPAVANYGDLNYFRSRLSVLSDGSILAGAINKLYYISKDFRTTQGLLNWGATDATICNLAFRSSTFQCGNHIRIHKVQSDGNTVLVCGTDAILPKCRLTTLSSGFTANIGSIISPEAGLVPFHPDFKGLTIDNDAFPGGVLAVNYLDAAQEDFGISYQFVDTSGRMINNTIQYRSVQGSDNWLLTPAAFVDYYADKYSVDDSLSFYFIFLTEKSVEISGTDNVIVYSRVVRICKNDPGAGIIRGADRDFRADYFKTFVKAYIYCERPMPSGADSIPGSTSYQYNIIQKVSLVRNSTYRIGVQSRDRVVYGLFTGSTYGPSGSAICVYSADMSGTKDRGIFDIFSEEYNNLRPGRTGCTANNIPNDNPFTCDTANNNASRPMPEFDILMSPAVDQLTTDPLVELNGITATTIYTTQTLVRRDPYSSPLIKVDVMLVGTNDGKILKIVMTYNGTAHVPLISEELSLADKLPIQNMEPQFEDGELDHLLLTTDSYIYRIPPHRCNRFDSCVDCVEARDPHCFWNQHDDFAQRGCKALPSRQMYDSQKWYQDINNGSVTQWNNCTADKVNGPLIIKHPVCSPSIIGNSYTFEFHANKPQAQFMCDMNSQGYRPCNGGRVTYTDLRKRRHIFTVRATANGESANKSITFVARHHHRYCHVYVCGDVVTVNGDSATVHFQSDDPHTNFQCRFRNRWMNPCHSPLQLTNLSPGNYDLRIHPKCSNKKRKGMTVTFTI